MVTEDLTPPDREVVDLDLRRVSDAETRAAIADLNSGCYGIPLQAGQDSIGHASLWTDVGVGRIGYVRGQPVCCAATRPVYEAMGYRAVTRFVFYAPPQV